MNVKRTLCDLGVATLARRARRACCTKNIFATLVLVATGLTHVSATETAAVAVLKIVAPDGGASILVPALHVATTEILVPDDRLWNGKRRILVEHLDSGEAEQRAMLFASGSEEPPAPWAKNLTSNELRIFHGRAACSHLSASQADWLLSRPSPWLANAIAYGTCEPIDSRDEMIMDMAHTLKLDVIPLESDDFAGEQRVSLPADVSEGGFRWTLAHDPATVLNATAALINAGRYSEMAKLVGESFGNARNARIAYRIMVEDRNIQWMSTMRRYLDLGGNVILVGAEHIPGPQGLMSMLRAAGYSVTPTTVPARSAVLTN